MYENEDEIHMKLYKSAMVKKKNQNLTLKISIQQIFLP